MPPVLALSTCWCSSRYNDGYQMLVDMANLGFEYVELSHGIRVTLVEGILRAVREGVVKVSTVHNFCPLPPHVTVPAPNLYEPSSPHARERSMWLKSTRKTLEFAAQVGGQGMVVHSGSVHFWLSNPEAKISPYEAEDPKKLAEDTDYQKLREKCLKKMRKAAPKYLERLKESYQSIVPLAKELGVKIMVENREGFTELPIDDEMATILADLGEEETIHYWHDCGHAQIKDRLGLIEHKELLKTNASRLGGFHIHDVSTEGRDHQCVGTGTIDFKMIREFMDVSKHIFVLELSPRLSREQVLESKAYVEELLALKK